MTKLNLSIITLVIISTLFFSTTNATELTNRITTGDNPKAKGLDIQMDFPATWQFSEGKRPNVVINAFSEGGRDSLGCVTTITINKNSENNDNFSLPQESVNLIESDPSIFYDAIAAEAKLKNVKGGKTIMDSELGIWLTGSRKDERLGEVFYSNTFLTLFWYKKWIVTSQCAVYSSTASQSNRLFQKYLPLIKKIMFTTVINTKWKQ